MIFLYNEFIYRPLLNLLVLGYNYIPGHDVGVVIILITLFVRVILAPVFHKQIKSQQAMTDLQPKLLEVQKIHENDREARARAMMELYKEHKVNPLGSCLPLLIQLPILFALYHVFIKALHGEISGLYSWVSLSGQLDPMFLGLINLAQSNVGLSILAGALQFWQSRLMFKIKKSSGVGNAIDSTAKIIQMQTLYFLPVFSVVIAWRLPAGLPLYWCVTTLFSIFQQQWLSRKNNKSATETAADVSI